MGSPSKGFSVLSGLLSPVSDGWVQTRSTTASFGFMTGGREGSFVGGNGIGSTANSGFVLKS